MENKTDSSRNGGSDVEQDTAIDSSKSHAFVNRVKQEDLRSTKSSPHRNVELHHTRSFSEICHLHPSSTDITCATTVYPKHRAIKELQHEVRRPESVLEISDLPSSESDDDSDENILETQQKGDEVMKIFLESNISIPLEGAMTSSSLSQETLDSDAASENELIVGNWEQEGRDSIASSGSSIEKRFLTPSGLMLYREHQVDSMLDTKRLKLTPSSSERPMSPLAMRRSDENVKRKTSRGSSGSGSAGNECRGKGRRCRMDSDSESEDDFDRGHTVGKGDARGKMMKSRDCNCDLRLEDLRQVVYKYEVQCKELINKNKEQYNEIRTLRKDNVNMHKEHNRLQVVIRECYQVEGTLKANMVVLSKERDQRIEQLRQLVQDLENKLQAKTSEIAQLKTRIDSHVEQETKYMRNINEINDESKALLEVLAKELDLEATFDVDDEETPGFVVALLKTRRQSLSDDFKNYYKNLNQTMDSNAVSETKNRMKEDFRHLSAGYKDTISKLQKTEKGMGKTLKRCASLETLLKRTEGTRYLEAQTVAQFGKTDLKVKLRELERKNDILVKENKMLHDDCAKWKKRYEQMLKNEKRGTTVVRVREEKPLPSEELQKLQKYLKQRRKSYSETQLETLQGDFSRFGKSRVEFNSTTGTPNSGNVEGLGDLESRLKQLAKLTQDLSQKIERSNENLGNATASFERERKQTVIDGGMKDNPDRMLSTFYGDSLFSVIKGVYGDHLGTLQENIHRREQECRYLREQLTVKASNEEITKCYIESLKRSMAISQEELRDCKNKNQDLKEQLREFKDRALITNAEREMSLYYCKKNGMVNGGLVKDEGCLDVGQLALQGDWEDAYGIIEESKRR